jgi:hypothetical protein
LKFTVVLHIGQPDKIIVVKPDKIIVAEQSVLKVAERKDDPRSRWLQNLCSRRNKNIAAVALANKNARIAWALLSKETDYLPEGEPA